MTEEPEFVDKLRQELTRAATARSARSRQRAAFRVTAAAGVTAVAVAVILWRTGSDGGEGVVDLAVDTTAQQLTTTESIAEEEGVDGQPPSNPAPDVIVDTTEFGGVGQNVHSPAVTSHDPGPLSPRLDTAMVVLADGRIMIWGGDMEGTNFGRPDLGWETFGDGAVFDPEAETWEMIAPTDLLPATDTTPAAVVTDDEVVVYRGVTGAAWNPTSNTWRPLPSAPADVTALGWDGERVVALGANAVLDPALGTWSVLADHAVLRQGSLRDQAWTGDRWMIAGGASGQVASVGADGEWSDYPNAPLASTIDWVTVTWLDGEFIVASWNSIMALDPEAGTWRVLPNVPLRLGKLEPDLASTDSALVAFGSGAAVLTNRGWRTAPNMARTRPRVSDGPLIWSYGLDRAAQPSLVSIDLDRMARSEIQTLGGAAFLAGGGVLEHDPATGGFALRLAGRFLEDDHEPCDLSAELIELEEPTAPPPSSTTAQLLNGEGELVSVDCGDLGRSGVIADRFVAARPMNESPVADAERLQPEVLSLTLVGMTVADAELRAGLHGALIRVTTENGVSQIVTLDLVANRINVATSDGIIVMIQSIG